jgi:hypothetical protein
MATESRKRSIVKTLTYRGVILCLDFLAIYLFTGKVEVALGFRQQRLHDGRLLRARAHLGTHSLGAAATDAPEDRRGPS